MATNTARFRFEFRLFDWAEGFSKCLAGERRPFFIGMRADGSIRRVYFARPDVGFDGDAKNKLVDSHPIWFLYSPYAEVGSGYVEWFEIKQSVAERWLESPLKTEDFLDVRASGNRDTWPASWRVIFG